MLILAGSQTCREASGAKQLNILLVEDDQVISRLIVKELAKAGYQVDWVDNGLDGFSKALNGAHQLCIVDVMLPEMDGLTMIEKLRARDYQTPILVLSAKRDVEDRVRGLETGGDDYLTKPFAFSELIARIKANTRRGSGALVPSVIKIKDLTIDLVNREVSRAGESIQLQHKEFDLLKYLAENADLVVSKEMIMKHVWDYQFDPQSNVIESRMSRLRDKVDKPFEVKLIQTIRGAGYAIRTDG